MADTVFPVGDFQTVAKAASELFARARNQTILIDVALLGNQVSGIAAFTVDLTLGHPGELVPIGNESLPNVTEQEAADYLKFVGDNGLPSSGASKAMYVAALLALLKTVVPYLPEPYKSSLQVLLNLIG